MGNAPPPLFPLDSPSLPSYEYSCRSNLEKLKLIAVSPKNRKERKEREKEKGMKKSVSQIALSP